MVVIGGDSRGAVDGALDAVRSLVAEEELGGAGEGAAGVGGETAGEVAFETPRAKETSEDGTGDEARGSETFESEVTGGCEGGLGFLFGLGVVGGGDVAGGGEHVEGKVIAREGGDVGEWVMDNGF